MYVAVLYSFTEAVEVLLDHGADVDTLCAKVKSTLHHLHSPCCFDTAVVCCHVIKPTLPGVCMSIVLHLGTPVTVQILCRTGLLCVWHVMTCQGDNKVQQASYAQLLDLSASVLTSASLRFCCHVELIPMVQAQM